MQPMTLLNRLRLLMIGYVLTRMLWFLCRTIWDRLVVYFVGRLVTGYVAIFTLLVLSAASLLCRSPLVAALSLGSSGDEYDG
ncbi:hypothetical protein V6N11_044246 [Hibiscus sabdariffa]|uniref:Uncharacterized protein n=1 Tax=Hibiscus sabdariffa TaxID=183260 RepID=A0ABR2RF77_9ROSI